MNNNNNDLLTSYELAAILDIHFKTVTGSLIKQGCPHTKQGKKYLFNIDDVSNWIQDNDIKLHAGRRSTKEGTELYDKQIELIGERIKKMKQERLVKDDKLINSEQEQLRIKIIIDMQETVFNSHIDSLAIKCNGSTSNQMREIIKETFNEIITTFSKQ